MHPKKIWANFGVSDPERTKRFYSALGFVPNAPHTSDELASFFFGDDQFVIHFFRRDRLEKSMEGDVSATASGNEIMFTLSAETRQEVDRWAGEVEKAGGRVLSPPAEFGKGWYGFVFTDPDGHKFNVFHM